MSPPQPGRTCRRCPGEIPKAVSLLSTEQARPPAPFGAGLLAPGAAPPSGAKPGRLRPAALHRATARSGQEPVSNSACSGNRSVGKRPLGDHASALLENKDSFVTPLSQLPTVSSSPRGQMPAQTPAPEDSEVHIFVWQVLFPSCFGFLQMTRHSDH